SRFSNNSTVHFYEEPVYDAEGEAYLAFSRRDTDIWVTVPHLPSNLSKPDENSIVSSLLGSILVKERMRKVALTTNPPASYVPPILPNVSLQEFLWCLLPYGMSLIHMGSRGWFISGSIQTTLSKQLIWNLREPTKAS